MKKMHKLRQRGYSVMTVTFSIGLIVAVAFSAFSISKMYEGKRRNAASAGALEKIVAVSERYLSDNLENYIGPTGYQALSFSFGSGQSPGNNGYIKSFDLSETLMRPLFANGVGKACLIVKSALDVKDVSALLVVADSTQGARGGRSRATEVALLAGANAGYVYLNGAEKRAVGSTHAWKIDKLDEWLVHAPAECQSIGDNSFVANIKQLPENLSAASSVIPPNPNPGVCGGVPGSMAPVHRPAPSFTVGAGQLAYAPDWNAPYSDVGMPSIVPAAGPEGLMNTLQAHYYAFLEKKNDLARDPTPSELFNFMDSEVKYKSALCGTNLCWLLVTNEAHRATNIVNNVDIDNGNFFNFRGREWLSVLSAEDTDISDRLKVQQEYKQFTAALAHHGYEWLTKAGHGFFLAGIDFSTDRLLENGYNQHLNAYAIYNAATIYPNWPTPRSYMRDEDRSVCARLEKEDGKFKLLNNKQQPSALPDPALYDAMTDSKLDSYYKFLAIPGYANKDLTFMQNLTFISPSPPLIPRLVYTDDLYHQRRLNPTMDVRKLTHRFLQQETNINPMLFSGNGDKDMEYRLGGYLKDAPSCSYAALYRVYTGTVWRQYAQDPEMVYHCRLLVNVAIPW